MRTLLAAMLTLCTVSTVFAASDDTMAKVRQSAATIAVNDSGAFVSGGSGIITFVKGELWCLTANHVIEDVDDFCTIYVKHCECAPDGKQAEIVFKADVQAWSTKLDLALLKIDKTTGRVRAENSGTFQFGPVEAIGNDELPIIDSPIISVGTYQGEADQSVSEGHLRWIGRRIAGNELDQGDFTVFEGSSGSGVFSKDGKLIGVTVRAIVSRCAFFVPVRVVMPWLESVGFGDIFTKPKDKEVKADACSCGCRCGVGCNCGCQDEIKCQCDTPNWLADGIWDAIGAAIVTAPHVNVRDFPEKLPRALERGIERFSCQAELWNMYGTYPWYWSQVYATTQTNITWARNQYVYTAKYPKLKNALRFPPYKIVQQYMDDANKDVESMNELLILTPYWRRVQVQPYVTLAERNQHGWEVMMNAVNTSAMWSMRREALGELRDMMGEEYFDSYQWFGK